MTAREAEIQGLQELKAKQTKIAQLNGKIQTLKSQIDKLRKQRTSTKKLNLLPTNTAEELEDRLVVGVARAALARRRAIKIGLIIAMVGLIAATDLLILLNNTFFLSIEKFLDQRALKMSDLWLFTGVFTVGVLLTAFFSYNLLVGGLVTLIAGVVALACLGLCAVVLYHLTPFLAALPPLALLACIIYMFLDWDPPMPPLNESQLQQIQQAREQDEANRIQNQKDRTAYSQKLELEQREKIMELNDQINDCEDQIDELESQLADNNLLVGDQLNQLDTVLEKLQLGHVSSIREALFGNVSKAYQFDEAESKQLDRKMRQSADTFAHYAAQQQAAQIAQENQQQADAHQQKIDKLHQQQNEVIEEIREIRKDR